MIRIRIFPLFVAVAFGCLFPGITTAEEAVKGEEVGVRALMQNPDDYPGRMTVTGVVSQVVAEAQVIGLIDVEEFKDCNKLTCAKLTLPVRWEGTMPEVGTRLAATGSINQEGRRYLFVATDLEVVPTD